MLRCNLLRQPAGLPGLRARAYPIRPASTCIGRRAVAVRSSKDGDNTLSSIVSSGTKLVDKASDLVPDSVPRPVARGGIAVLGGLFIFGLIQKVLSGFVTLLLLGGVGYYFFTRGGSDDDDSRGNKGADDSLDDPLADARRIMDKYK